MSVPPASLEQDLMARHARRHPPARAGAWAFVRAHRWALSCGLAGVAVAGACQMPLDYDRSFGVTVWCTAPTSDVFDGDGARGLADSLHQKTGAEQVAVRVHAQPGEATLRIDLWGAGPALAAEDLLAETTALASLPDTSCSVEPLVETVHGTLGGRLGLELFDLELLDRDDAEHARAQILGRLEARGLRGDAEVEVTDLGDGRREVKIRIEAEAELPE